MTELEWFLLKAELPRLKAQLELHQRQCQSTIDAERLKDLILLDTEDEDYADKTAAEYLMSQIKSGALEQPPYKESRYE